MYDYIINSVVDKCSYFDDDGSMIGGRCLSKYDFMKPKKRGFCANPYDDSCEDYTVIDQKGVAQWECWKRLYNMVEIDDGQAEKNFRKKTDQG